MLITVKSYVLLTVLYATMNLYPKYAPYNMIYKCVLILKTRCSWGTICTALTCMESTGLVERGLLLVLTPTTLTNCAMCISGAYVVLGWSLLSTTS